MKILISGTSGAGKTTLCERILKMARHKGLSCGGVLCPRAGQGSIAVDLLTGKREKMASTNPESEGIPAGNHFLNEDGIALAKKAISSAIDNGSDLIFIDEIGPLERTGKGLSPETKRALATGKDTVIVIREKMIDEFTGKFPGIGFRKFIITRKNRNPLAEKIMGELNEA